MELTFLYGIWRKVFVFYDVKVKQAAVGAFIQGSSSVVAYEWLRLLAACSRGKITSLTLGQGSPITLLLYCNASQLPSAESRTNSYLLGRYQWWSRDQLNIVTSFQDIFSWLFWQWNKPKIACSRDSLSKVNGYIA